MSLLVSKNPQARESRLEAKFVEKVVYQLNFSPDNKFQKFGQKLRWKTVHNAMRELMREVHQITGEKFLYELYQELSTPTTFQGNQAGGRIHYHGVMYFKNRQAMQGFFMLGSTVLSDYGRVDIDTIDDLEYWAKYCRKGQDIWPEALVITNCAHSIMDRIIERDQAEPASASE